MPRPSNEETLEYYLSLSYLAKVATRDGRHMVFITELALMEEDQDLNAAYARLDEARQRRLTQMVEAGLQRLIPLPSVLEQRRHWLYSLRPFAVKTVVVVALIGALFVGLRHVSLPGLVPIMETAMAKINDIPEDRIRQLTKEAGRVAKKLRPVIDEMQNTLSPPTPQASSADMQEKSRQK